MNKALKKIAAGGTVLILGAVAIPLFVAVYALWTVYRVFLWALEELGVELP